MRQTIQKGLLLLGSFAIAYILAEFLHELGHALSAWTTGGTVFGIYVHPFNWSYCSFTCDYPIYRSASGAGFSSIIAIMFFSVIIRWPKMWLLPLLLAGPITLINNGDYLLIDVLFKTGGDSCSLIGMGIPLWSILIVSAILLLAGFAMAFVLIRKIGLLTGTFGQRLTILTLGIVTYLVIAEIWNFFYDRNAISDWGAYTISGIVLTLIIAALPFWNTKKEEDQQIITWKPIIAINTIAVSLVLTLLAICPLLPGSDIESFSERPEDFPAVLEAPPFATNISYSKSEIDLSETGGRLVFLSYSFPESTPQEQIQQFITDTYKNSGYILLTDSSDASDQPRNNHWIEESELFNGVPIKSNTLTQMYFKFDSKIFYSSYVSISYVWRKGKFQDAHAMNAMHEFNDFEQVKKLFGQERISQFEKLIQENHISDPNTLN